MLAGLANVVSFGVSLFAVLCAVLLLVKYLRPGPKHPPGPPGWPVLGNILTLSLKGAWESLAPFKEIYGTL